MTLPKGAKHILVIDDDNTSREVTRRILKGLAMNELGFTLEGPFRLGPNKAAQKAGDENAGSQP